MVAGSVPKAYDIVMEKASASWVGELSRTRTEFAALKRRLSEVVRRHNNESATTTQPIPDPVRLLERMSTLEASLDQLEVDCREVCAKRQTLAKETADALLRNAQLIQELSARTGGCDGNGDTGVDGDNGHDRFWTEDLVELAKQRDALHNMPALASSSSGNEGAT